MLIWLVSRSWAPRRLEPASGGSQHGTEAARRVTSRGHSTTSHLQFVVCIPWQRFQRCLSPSGHALTTTQRHYRRMQMLLSCEKCRAVARFQFVRKFEEDKCDPAAPRRTVRGFVNCRAETGIRKERGELLAARPDEGGVGRTRKTPSGRRRSWAQGTKQKARPQSRPKKRKASAVPQPPSKRSRA